MTPKKILLINAHSDKSPRLSGSIIQAYAEGAKNQGAEVRIINLAELNFDPILRHGYGKEQPLEEDLQKAQQDIKWAEHLVIVYPTWWGMAPAILKGFIDRTFTSGFAFKYKENSPWWDKLLSGKSARIITTMDAPPLIYKLLFSAPGDKFIKTAVLSFCGVKPVKFTHFGPVRTSTEQQRKKWLQKCFQLGLNFE